MKIDVIMPKMGESLQEGTILKWLKSVGDKIERDEMILEISTDKVDTEVPAPVAGTLAEILAQEGDTVDVGTVIAIIETDELDLEDSIIKTQEIKISKEKPSSVVNQQEKSDMSSSNIVEVIMPKMGESLQEGTILKWLKSVGDKIERDEMILEISTDKVDTEVPAPVAGTLAEILAQEGDTVDVGSVIAIIETDELDLEDSDTKNQETEISKEKPSSVVNQQEKSDMSSSNIVEVIMPKMGESLQEGTILKWLKSVDDKIERDEMILEISTDKVDTEVPAPAAGTLVEILSQEGDTVDVGTVIAKIQTEGNVSIANASEETVSDNTSSVLQDNNEPRAFTPSGKETKEIPRSDGKRFYSPLVRSIAQAEGISLEELQTINGSGADGRLTKKDLTDYLKNRRSAKQSSSQSTKEQSVQAASVSKSPAPSIDKRDVEIIPMDRVRQLIAEHMIRSKQTSAHVTSVEECDVTDLVKFREKHKDEFFKREGVKLTYTPFFAKALIDTVRQYPRINVSVDGTNIILHKRTHLSFATALDDGNLIVPVIKNADSLGITGLTRAIYDLATRARTKKLLPEEIQGGTIALTNVGTFGTLFGTPVINQPQTAIVGVGAIKKQPVVREINGEDVIAIRHIMYVSITYDHRVIDGMLAGKALAQINQNLENMNENTLTL